MFREKVQADLGYKNAAFFDDLGNKITGKDRRVFLKCYIKILNKEDPYIFEDVYSRDVYAVIQKTEAYLDENYLRQVAVIYL